MKVARVSPSDIEIPQAPSGDTTPGKTLRRSPKASDGPMGHLACMRAPQKSTPYFPQKQRALVSLNERVKIKGEPIACRHLAPAYLAANKASAFLDEAQSKTSLKALFTQKISMQATEASSERFFNAPENRKCLIDNQHFGQWIGDMVSDMLNARVGQCRTMIYTPEHAMAVRIDIKPGPNNAPRACITCYDPNVTGNHMRFEASDLKQLSGRSLKECFPGLPDYFHDAVSNDDAVLTASTPDMPRSRFEPARYLTPSSAPVAIQHSLNDNAPQSIANIFAQLQRANVDLGALGQKLSLPDIHGRSPLHYAMDREHFTAISTFFRGAKSIGLTGQHALGFLNATDAAGDPALSDALRDDSTNRLTIFVEMMHTLDVRGAQAAPILSAKDAKGYPAIFHALTCHSDQCVAQLGNALKHLEVPHAEALSLMKARNAKGRFGFSGMMLNDETTTKDKITTMHAFLKALKDYGFSAGDIAEITNETFGGQSLSARLKEDDPESYRAYRQALSAMQVR